MSKKKKDFQKVKVKLGRKLKSQNETVINLSKKRIILPKEREFKKTEGDKTDIQTFDNCIHSLNIEDSALQHSSLRTLNRLLDPLTKQLNALPFLDRNVLTVSSNFIEKVIDGHQKLLGISSNLGCNIQLGNLIFMLGRFCKRVDDPRFCGEIRQLFIKIVQIASTHPKISDIIYELDQVIIYLLQRTEHVWKFFGCQLASYVFGLHCRLVTTMSQLYNGSNRTKAVYSGVFDSVQQFIRFRAYCHLLIQCYSNLKQNRTFKVLSKSRADLVQASMVYLKDNQYTSSLSYSQGNHPWLYSLPYFGHQRSTQCYVTFKGYYLKELIDFHPVSYNLNYGLFGIVKQSLMFPKNMTVNNENVSIKRSENSRKNSIEVDMLKNDSIGGTQMWCQEDYDDQVLGHGLIEEGLILLDELTEHPSEEILSSLYYFLRGLRVLFETKSVDFFTSYSSVKNNHSGWKSDINNISPDLSTSLERFLMKFYAVYPLQLSDNNNNNNDRSLIQQPQQQHRQHKKGMGKQAENYLRLLNTFNGQQKSVNLLSRKQLKQERKRKNKQLRRQMTIAGGDSSPITTPTTTTTEMEEETSDPLDESIIDSMNIDNVSKIPSTRANSSNINNHNNNNQISHWINLINLSAFELFTYIEYYSLKCSEVSGHSPFLWPPPDDMQERLIKLWFDQLSEFLLMSNTTITTTTDIIYDISHWLRAFDLYLFAPCRLKWSIDTSTRLFIPPVIIYLGQLFHQLSMNTLDKDKYLSKKEHFLIGRCAGLLTTFLTKDLLVNRQNKIELNSNSCESEDENLEVDFHAIEYDEMWIWKKSCISLSDTGIQPVYGSIFTSLVNCLAKLSLKEPPRVCYAPPLSEHTLDSILVLNKYKL
ncbi:unnamed protein product [Trichobilharzia szidati]|nr:unnamed protein product [Trichobilharzia szidati]